MNFPEYVPHSVRLYLTDLIEGNDWAKEGWKHAYVNVGKELEQIKHKINICNVDADLQSLKVELTEVTKRYNEFEENINCLYRLATDSRMKEVYTLLSENISDDRDLNKFIYAAWAAKSNFSVFRNRVKRATELNSKIMIAANRLENLIKEFEETGVNGPNEFYGVMDILEKTDNYKNRNHNFEMWRSLRHVIFGYDVKNNNSDDNFYLKEEGYSSPKIEVIFGDPKEKHAIDPVKSYQNTIKYIWGLAPDFSALLRTVADAAKHFKPEEDGVVRAAIAKRESNPKTEFLRAFSHLLKEGHEILIGPIEMNAMALIANVVINLPHIDVSYDDVAKTINNFEKSQ
jgi:hypothetical protein